ncbi:MAG: hypothetical protein QXF56_04965 [Candidatus Micrarchaeia archaeon]
MECAYHPEKEAVSECSVCGKPLCKECGSICEECLARKELAESGKVKLMNWEGWFGSFLTPTKTFRVNRMNSSFAGVCMNLLAGLVNAGVIASLLFIAVGARDAIVIFSYTTPFLEFLGAWLFIALISYPFAMIAGGMGSLKQHLYILSLPVPFSPVILGCLWLLLNFLFSIHLSVGLFGAIIATAYLIRIQTSGVREAHKLGGMQAMIAGTVPIVVCGIIAVLISAVLRK